MGHPLRRRSVGRVAAALIGALAAGASVGANDTMARERAEALRNVASWSRHDFMATSAAGLGAELQARVETMARDHQARVDRSAEAWLDELIDRFDLPVSGLVRSLMARYANELVRWQLDRVDEADDMRLLLAMRDQGLCAALQAPAPFERWIEMVKRLPESEREAAVRAQETLLTRWGDERADPPQRPDVPWISTARAALQRLREADRPSGEPPTPPVLMWLFFVGKASVFAPAERCTLARWMLEREPLRQASALERASYMRSALAWDAANDIKQPRAGSDGYPPIARQFLVEGKVRVKGRARASGIGLDSAVISKRDIRVEGLGPVRPVAFEGLLDEASLQRAATVKTDSNEPGKPVVLEFVWKLE